MDWVFRRRQDKKNPTQGGAVVTLSDAPDDRGASWGKDGSIIAALNSTAGLSRIPSAGGSTQALTRPIDAGELTHRWPQILPGGAAVLFTANIIGTGAFDDATIDVL